VRENLSNVPQIIYGFTAGLNYKNFDFTLLLQGQARSVQYVLTESGEVGNYFSSWADNRWSPTNPDGTYPRVDVRTSSSINGALYRNNFWLYNTAFLRIKNVELGYNLPVAVAEKVRLTGARVYVSAFNLATFSKVKDFDPEGQSESAQFYPQQQIFNVGVNLKF
jgi:TonB-dependent starch-binding outer membrane protein SusC